MDLIRKKSLLAHILKDEEIRSALIFTRTKHGADRVAKDLKKAGITAEAIHGNKSQNARQKALGNFKENKTRVLVATDIAARGIDVEELSHVVNFELPNIPETYVHRIGRTGRAGANGVAISFCDMEEAPYLRDIQKLISKTIPIVESHPFEMEKEVAAEALRASTPVQRNNKSQVSVSKEGNGTGKSKKKFFYRKGRR